MPTRLKAAALTDRGQMRPINEDTVFQKVTEETYADALGLFIVADGLGGRLAGEAASYWAVESIKNSLSDLINHRDPRATHSFTRQELEDLMAADFEDPDNLKERVIAAVEKANRVVRDYARHKPDEARGAGSTISMALVDGREAVIANVGDSRTYLLRAGQLGQITKDHSLVQRLIDEGRIQESDRYTHPNRNLVYRSLGAKEIVDVDVFAVSLLPNDILLLCTDGLWEMIQNPTQIASIIQSAASLETACQRLIDTANAAGGEDNIGVVLAKVLE
jgi:protein phosphatase